jgi:two-component system sensor histidine kinase UhpB
LLLLEIWPFRSCNIVPPAALADDRRWGGEFTSLATLLQTATLISGRHSARAYLIAIVVVVLAPALISGGLLTASFARSERAQIEQSARDQTREAGAAIERDIVAIQHVLMTLAGSHFLQTGDIEAFYKQAANVSRQVGVVITLRDPRLDQQIVNTARPWGSPPPSAPHAPFSEAEKETLRSGKSVVTNVFFGRSTRQNLVAVAVPVFRGNDFAFVLSAGVPLIRFAELLWSLNIGHEQVVGVLDRNGAYVARSANHTEYAGTRAKYSLPRDVHSVVTGIDREGIAFHWFNRQSDALGWIVFAGVPDQVLDGPMIRAMAIFAGVASLALGVGLALAHHWGGRISQSLGTLGIDRRPTGEEFEILFDSSPNGVMVIDSQGRIVLLNGLMGRKFGYPADELIGKSVEILVPERFRDGHLGLRRAFALDPKARPMGAGRDLYGRRKDGTEFPVEIGLNPINSGADKLVMVTVVDISARKQAAERLTAAIAERDDLRRRFINAQEQERVRLAHELHDQTGQRLTAVMLEIKGVEDSIGEPGRSRLRLLRLQLEQVGQTLHHVAWELRPASIDELGLQVALANYVAEWSEQYGIEADFYCGDLKTDALSEEICTTVYRVAQEALTNVVKHAQATSVSVVIEQAGDKLRLTIEDNGCGFKVDSSSDAKGSRSGGLGVAGMRERLVLIGGEFEIESSIGVGTTIFARIPLEPKRIAA